MYMRQVTAVTIFYFFLKHKAEKNGTAYIHLRLSPTNARLRETTNMGLKVTHTQTVTTYTYIHV